MSDNQQIDSSVGEVGVLELSHFLLVSDKALLRRYKQTMYGFNQMIHKLRLTGLYYSSGQDWGGGVDELTRANRPKHQFILVIGDISEERLISMVRKYNYREVNSE